ncbi:MAG: VanZ family protein [Planctomycetes bacterium]|nr:VanZ family protein [Planctomycetota bacterium]
MPKVSSYTTTAPAPLASGITGAFQFALQATLVLLPTVFGNLHRFGGFELLLLVCLLQAFWVVSGLLGPRLWHLRSWANLLGWGLLGFLLFQVLPLPLGGLIGGSPPSLGTAASILVESASSGSGLARLAALPVVRYSLRPTASVGVLILVAAVAGLFWLVGSATGGHKHTRRTTWAVVLGLSALALWAAMVSAGAPARDQAVIRPAGPVMVLGGDGLVPALLAALPLCVAVVLRPLGWMPRLDPRRRQSRLGWLDRGATAWAGIGIMLTGLVAAALGMSNVPRHVLVAAVVLSCGPVLGGYVVRGPGAGGARRPVGIALALALWIVGATAAGSMLGNPRQAASSADGRLAALAAAMPAERSLLGVGAGSVSSRETMGVPGWPAAPGDDVDTDGYLLLRVEFGWAGLALVLGAAVAMAVVIVRACRVQRGPWPRTAMMAGLGALAANLFYFRLDAVALLAPNLVALACVLGVVIAWAAHGASWRPARAGEMGESHWPLVFGAVVLVGALGLAEQGMLAGADAAPHLSDKVLHFGTFSVISLLLCYALGPRPTSRHLKTRIFLAVLGTGAMGVLMEFGQKYLTSGRSFEGLDILANTLGALTMGLLWWVVRRSQMPRPDMPDVPA